MAKEISVRIEGTRELQAAIVRYGERALFVVARALYEEAERIMTVSKQLVPVGVTGNLRNSGFVAAPQVGVGLRDVEVVLGYGGPAATHAIYVHEGVGPAVGRPAFFPPPAAFEAWAAKKPGDRRLAFVVARSVGARGFEGKKFLERPFRAAAVGMGGRVANRIRRELGG